MEARLVELSFPSLQNGLKLLNRLTRASLIQVPKGEEKQLVLMGWMSMIHHYLLGKLMPRLFLECPQSVSQTLVLWSCEQPWDHFHLEGVILKSVDMETKVHGAYRTV